MLIRKLYLFHVFLIPDTLKLYQKSHLVSIPIAMLKKNRKRTTKINIELKVSLRRRKRELTRQMKSMKNQRIILRNLKVLINPRKNLLMLKIQ